MLFVYECHEYKIKKDNEPFKLIKTVCRETRRLITDCRMTEFAYSIVLFSGDDGLPLEFNIQYAVEKCFLKSLIERGGGMCTLDDDAIYLVSPGTKVLNIDPGKKLISTKYIFDCVKENYLLDTDGYRIEINEMETSDFSDNSPNVVGNGSHQNRRSSSDATDDSVDILESEKSPPNANCAESNHAFDFENSQARNNNTDAKKEVSAGTCAPIVITLQSPIKLGHAGAIEHMPVASNNTPDTVPAECDNFPGAVHAACDNIPHSTPADCDNSPGALHAPCSDIPHITPEDCDNVLGTMFAVCDNIPDSLEKVQEPNDRIQNLSLDTETRARTNVNISNNNVPESSASAVVVSSSQQSADALDQFDKEVLNKINEKTKEKEEDCLSQSYTVSSSADAQVSPKPPSHHTSAEIFEENSPAPDSASQASERQLYIKNLEKEIEEILKKPPPKSIEDKLVFVKYICCVKKLSPAVVLNALQNH